MKNFKRKKYVFSHLYLRALQGSKADSERIRPQHPSFYGRNRATLMRLRTLLYMALA